jgi:predicted  nucleic acid-binding Zn-ribbon protein
MFDCVRCGSRYSEVYAAALESCPRCLARDRVSEPLRSRDSESVRSGTAAGLTANKSRRSSAPAQTDLGFPPTRAG